MELNIKNATTFQFESRDNLKNAAKSILSKQCVSEEAAEKFVEKSVFNETFTGYTNSQLAAIKAAAQISINGTLKETLKYLREHANKNVKKAVLGELWTVFENTESTAVEKQILDLTEFEIDDSIVNIFAA